MKILRIILSVVFLSVMSIASFAHEITFGDLTISHPWMVHDKIAEATAQGFFKITNNGNTDIRLMNGATFDAMNTFIRQYQTDANNFTRIVRMPDGIVIPAGQTVEFSPTTYDLFFQQVRRIFDPGEQFPVVLTFENLGPLELEFEVTESISEDH